MPRRSGKTLGMVMRLPAECVVIVHTAEMARYLMRMIHHFRRDVDAKVIVISVHSDLHLHAQQLRGGRKPIYVDHGFLENTEIELNRYLSYQT